MMSMVGYGLVIYFLIFGAFLGLLLRYMAKKEGRIGLGNIALFACLGTSCLGAFTGGTLLPLITAVIFLALITY
jgi:CHASE2 domain-containing sensor protein